MAQPIIDPATLTEEQKAKIKAIWNDLVTKIKSGYRHYINIDTLFHDLFGNELFNDTEK